MSAGRFRRSLAADAAELLTSPGGVARAPAVDRHSLARLPAPVRTYLAAALEHRATTPANLRLRHVGRFKPDLSGPWRAIAGEQYFAADPPGFVWWGRVKLAPGIWVDARDRALHGAGSMLVTLASTFQLLDRSGPELDQGALLRLLSELVLLPSALADARYISWAPLDAASARATLTLAGRSVTGVFEYDERSLPRRFSTQRYRDTGRGKAALVPWSGEYDDYRYVADVLIPHRLRGYWHDGERVVQYVDFELTSAEYDTDEPFAH